MDTHGKTDGSIVNVTAKFFWPFIFFSFCSFFFNVMILINLKKRIAEDQNFTLVYYKSIRKDKFKNKYYFIVLAKMHKNNGFDPIVELNLRGNSTFAYTRTIQNSNYY